jgi:hypothetical protein
MSYKPIPQNTSNNNINNNKSIPKRTANKSSCSYNFQNLSELFSKHKHNSLSLGNQTLTTNFQSTQSSLIRPPSKETNRTIPIKTVFYNDLVQPQSIKSLTITKVYSPPKNKAFHKRSLTNSFNDKVVIKKPQTPKYETINTLIADPALFDSKMNTINSYIDTIKTCKIERMNKRINNTNKKKVYINNKVNDLHSCVSHTNLLNRHRCCNFKGIEKETDRLRATSLRMARSTFYINKEIPLVRNEIKEMKKKIYLLNKQSKEYMNEIYQLNQDIVNIKDNILNVHNLIHDIVMQKEKIQNLTQVYKKQTEQNRHKALLTVKASNMFIENIYAFAKDAYEDDKQYND